jgi:predicted amino acid dehydrogenase
VAITTGHAYTVFNVTQTLLNALRAVEGSIEKSTVAIVGASGSIGSGCAQVLAEYPFKKLLLIDVIKKNEDLTNLVAEIERMHPHIAIEVSHKIQDIKAADYIVTATNTPEALVKADDLKSGAVVVDDAQPSDIHPSVYERDDVLVLEAGAVHTPGISAHLRLGLKSKYDNFSCLAELLLLASMEYTKHYAVGRTTLAQIKEVGQWGTQLNFQTAQFQNEHDTNVLDRIQHIKHTNRQ